MNTIFLELNNIKRPVDVALWWAGHAVPVFPVANYIDKKTGKIVKAPRTDHGFKDASTDPDLIREWWRLHPRAAIGGATGLVSGLFVLDIDKPEPQIDPTKPPKPDGRISMKRLLEQYGPLPDGILTVQTPRGGYHLYMMMPEHGEDVDKSESLVAPGVDVRANKGFIILAGSVREDGARYIVLEGGYPND